MGAETAGAPVAPAVRRGIVSRGVLFGRLTGARRVTVLSAQAGSGKTFLLPSWIEDAGPVDPAAWVAVPGGARDSQRFWVSGAGGRGVPVARGATGRGRHA